MWNDLRASQGKKPGGIASNTGFLYRNNYEKLLKITIGYKNRLGTGGKENGALLKF
ncbi:hypothetical protein [Crenobacter cavernae]|uniref:hypothetical protein n=1 Tax=Crenobacter cavernae TaxID=2290923 RepID=UPI0015F12855|nr:hypothetical protein [Crenobacter cavernae]